MQNGNGNYSRWMQGFVNGIVESGDRKLIEPLRNIAAIVKSAAMAGAVGHEQNQKLQKEFALMQGRFQQTADGPRTLPDEFVLLASGFESDMRLRNTVVKLYPLACDILARTEQLPPRPSTVRPISRNAEETSLPN